METVRRLTPDVRTFATYDGSLKVLAYLASKGVKQSPALCSDSVEKEEEIS